MVPAAAQPLLGACRPQQIACFSLAALMLALFAATFVPSGGSWVPGPLAALLIAAFAASPAARRRLHAPGGSSAPVVVAMLALGPGPAVAIALAALALDHRLVRVTSRGRCERVLACAVCPLAAGTVARLLAGAAGGVWSPFVAALAFLLAGALEFALVAGARHLSGSAALRTSLAAARERMPYALASGTAAAGCFAVLERGGALALAPLAAALLAADHLHARRGAALPEPQAEVVALRPREAVRPLRRAA